MKQIVIALAAASLATSATALPPPASIDTIQQRAMEDRIAWDITEGLTTEVGQRMPGTEAEARARTWSLAKLKSLGFKNVREENFMMPTWVRGEEEAMLVAPVPHHLEIAALGNSGSTGPQGLTGDVVYFDSLAALQAADGARVRGKIVFVDHDMRRTMDGSGYGFYGPVRWFGPNMAAKKGAAAYVIRSIGTDFHRNPHTGNTNFEEGVTPIPAGAISNPDADTLRRLLSKGQAGRMLLKLTPRNIGQQESGNVIAEVPGSDPSLPMILVACHLDSWDLAPSAFDDAAGCGIVTAAAHNIMTSGTQPKRTIRILWAGAEEVGLWGGKDYAAKHSSEAHGLVMESDFGADRVWRVEFAFPESAKALQDRIVAELLPLSIGNISAIRATGGADIQGIIATNNPAIIDLQQDGTRYFDLHHTPDDTLDKVDKEQLRQNVAAWSTVLKLVADSDADLTMPPKP